MDPHQLVFSEPTFVTEESSIWKSILLPVYAGFLSIGVAVIHIGLLATPFKKYLKPPPLNSRFNLHAGTGLPAGVTAQLRANIESNAGFTIWASKVLRLIGCLFLALITIGTSVGTRNGAHHTNGTHWSKRQGDGPQYHENSGLSDRYMAQISLFALYIYASVLAFCTLVLPKQYRGHSNVHLSLLLIVTWSVYMYRDVWPLATFTLEPIDPDHWSTWSTLAVITIIGVLTPILTPFEYVPIDPEHPSETPNPEQTASWLSFLCFNFMDPVVYAAATTDHLKYGQLPPLADFDAAAYQTKTSFPHLDPTRTSHRRHVVWGLLAHFHKQYLACAVLLFLKIVIGFAGPLGINRLLTYIETGGKGAIVRPWVWILWLLIGPLAGNVARQTYTFIITRNVVHVEGIITQLVFEQSLRIRMKEDAPPADTPNEGDTLPLPELEPPALVPPGVLPSSSTNGRQAEATAAGSIETSKSSSTPDPKGKARTVSSMTPSIRAVPVTSSGKRQGNLVGKINNLISTDLGNIKDAGDFMLLIWDTPLQVAVCVWFLYSILGYAAILGMAVLVASLPIPSLIGTLLNHVQTERMKRTDARVQSVTEYLNVLRMIKLFAWEDKIKQKIEKRREDELHWTRKRQFLQLLHMQIKFVLSLLSFTLILTDGSYILPLLTMVVTFSSYVIIFKHELTASRVFSSMAVFDLLRDQLRVALWGTSSIIQGKVSMDRLTEFLYDVELLDKHTQERKGASIHLLPPPEPDVIGFHNATFSWAEKQPGTPASGGRDFRLRIDGDLFFRRGGINMIIGPTGCGKTSILMSLLGEMHFQPASPDSWYNLPREGGVSFAPQVPWILNETIRDNVLFGSAFDAVRYKKVLYQCALETDLSMFEAGDQTEVGEQGLTLSGGQKARISLARAIYAQSQIILLDDVLSALDVHTVSWIVGKCLKGDLVKDRTILIVTHNVAIVNPIATFVVTVGLDGRISSSGTFEQALETGVILRDTMILEEQQNAKEQEVVDAPTEAIKIAVNSATGKLIMVEEVTLGRVNWSALRMFLQCLGGSVFWISFLSGFLLTDLFNIIQTFWLGFWASQYEGHSSSEVNVGYYLAVYGAFLLAAVVVYSGVYILYLFASISASRQIHEKLTSSVLGTTLHWLDTTPVGRIISRFTLDIRAVDGPITSSGALFVERTVTMLSKLGAVVYMTPAFVIPGIAMGTLGAWLGNLYIKAQLPVKREMANSRSPIFSHFHAAIAGLPSIRAYGVEEKFRVDLLKRIDKYTRCARSFYNLNRWIAFRMNFLGALFSSGLAAYLIYVRPSTASNVGFSLTMAIAFSGIILWWVRIGNEFEVSCNSLERIEQYINCEQEQNPTESGKPPAHWPSSGHLVIEKLSAAYSTEETAPAVLRDISLEVKSGERVGVVGRTGSGKSSLMLSLLRLIPTKGSVTLDGLATEHVNLNSLRRHVTIIPQQPELLSGTLRDNLDPFGEYDDVTLNDALQSSGLNNVQLEGEDGYMGLDAHVASGGSNFSLGQRQMIALSRAICRRSKVVILDEATAAIDHSTDAVIQASIRSELKNATVITVAHRLKTIGDSDKVIVLDAGRLVEFDSPALLLQKKGGFFKSLVDESGEREELYRMAGIKLD